MKIYFAGAIRGGREDSILYSQIITLLESKGTVLTEHIGHSILSEGGESKFKDDYIFERDLGWINLGVGYELCLAEQLSLPVLCLYRDIPGKSISAMIKGNKYFICKRYNNIKEINNIIDHFFNSILN